MNNWRYVLNGQTIGPVDLNTLQGLIDNGTLTRETLVQKEGTNEWLPAQSVPDLKFANAPKSSAPVAQPSSPSAPPPVDSDAADIEKNKVFAIIGYIGILFLVPMLAAPNSRFARYHANQGLVLFLTSVTLSVGSMILSFIPYVGCLVVWVPFVVMIGSIVLMVLGIINAANGHTKPLPLIGHITLLK